MSLGRVLNKPDAAAVHAVAGSAVWHSHADAHARCSPSSPREEDVVASMLHDGVNRLRTGWGSILAPYGVKVDVAGVFCHGTPLFVEIPSIPAPKNVVELSDLLVVHGHTDAAGRFRCVAKLLQVKMSTTPLRTLKPNDVQLHLYEKWPDFRFTAKSGMRQHLRQIGVSRHGAEYAIAMDGHAYPEQILWADQCPWGVAAPAIDLCVDRSFAKVLGDMLLLRDGRQVGLHRPRGEWSRTVKELLDTAGQKGSNWVQRAGGNARRNVAPGPIMSALLESNAPTTAAGSHFGGRDDDGGGLGEMPEPKPGVSLLLISSSGGDVVERVNELPNNGIERTA